VSWKLPDGSSESPIPGERLSVEHRIAPLHQTQFVPLEMLSAQTSAGTVLTAHDDGQILATSTAKQPEQYKLLMKSSMQQLTAVRLEALSRAELPGGGPGVSVAGRFTVTDVHLSLMSDLETSASPTIEFAGVLGHDGGDLTRLIDGNEATVWRGKGRGKPASVVFLLREPLQLSQAKLLITIGNREGLGCFRISATSAADPRKLEVQGPVSPTKALALDVNLGSETYTAPDGVVWKPSKMFDNETFGHEGGRIVTEKDAQNPVQGSALRGIQAFRAVVPNGTYEVTLYFCEYWTSNPNSRVFSIGAEKRLVVRNLDLLNATGGVAMPLAYPIRNVVVKDHRLDIEFQPLREGSSAVLNAIRIRQAK